MLHRGGMLVIHPLPYQPVLPYRAPIHLQTYTCEPIDHLTQESFLLFTILFFSGQDSPSQLTFSITYSKHTITTYPPSDLEYL